MKSRGSTFPEGDVGGGIDIDGILGSTPRALGSTPRAPSESDRVLGSTPRAPSESDRMPSESDRVLGESDRVLGLSPHALGESERVLVESTQHELYRPALLAIDASISAAAAVSRPSRRADIRIRPYAVLPLIALAVSLLSMQSVFDLLTSFHKDVTAHTG